MVKVKILLIDQFDLKRETLNRDVVSGNKLNYIKSSDRVLIHKADYVFYIVEKSIMEPRYVNILKARDSTTYDFFRDVLNKLIDRQHYLFELSSMLKLKLVSYKLKDFIIDEFTKHYGDEVQFLNKEVPSKKGTITTYRKKPITQSIPGNFFVLKPNKTG